MSESQAPSDRGALKAKALRALQDVHRRDSAYVGSYDDLTPDERADVDRIWWASRFIRANPDALSNGVLEAVRLALGVENGMGMARGFTRRVSYTRNFFPMSEDRAIQDVDEVLCRIFDVGLPARSRRIAIVAAAGVALIDSERHAKLVHTLRRLPQGPEARFAASVVEGAFFDDPAAALSAALAEAMAPRPTPEESPRGTVGTADSGKRKSAMSAGDATTTSVAPTGLPTQPKRWVLGLLDRTLSITSPGDPPPARTLRYRRKDRSRVTSRSGVARILVAASRGEDAPRVRDADFTHARYVIEDATGDAVTLVGSEGRRRFEPPTVTSTDELHKRMGEERRRSR